MKQTGWDIMFAIGICLTLAGVAMIYQPAVLVIGGITLCAMGVIGAREQARKPKPKLQEGQLDKAQE